MERTVKVVRLETDSFINRVAAPVTPKKAGEVYVEPFMGWRIWLISHKDGKPYLCSVMRDPIWPPLEPCCAEGSLEKGAGIHAFWNEPDMSRGAEEKKYRGLLPSIYFAVGRVALWGKIAVHEYGCRAQFAYPQAPIYVFGAYEYPYDGPYKYPCDDLPEVLTEMYKVKFEWRKDEAWDG